MTRHLVTMHLGKQLAERCDELQGAIDDSLSELSATVEHAGTCDLCGCDSIFITDTEDDGEICRRCLDD